MSAIAFRPYLPADAARCAAIFRDAIEFSAADDYDEDQRAAWAARADDEDAFGAKLAGQLTIVATLEGFVVAFASLKGAEELDMLYVDPAAGRQGVGAALVDARRASRASARREAPHRARRATSRSRCSTASDSPPSAEASCSSTTSGSPTPP